MARRVPVAPPEPLLADLAQRPQQRGSFRLREFADQRLVHDPGVNDQGAVNERGPGVGQADDGRAAVALGRAASQQTARFQARSQRVVLALTPSRWPGKNGARCESWSLAMRESLTTSDPHGSVLSQLNA